MRHSVVGYCWAAYSLENAAFRSVAVLGVGVVQRSAVSRVLPGLMLVMLLGALDQTIMAPALPVVAAELGGLDRMPAVVTAYLAAATVVMPLYGKLGDRFGRRAGAARRDRRVRVGRRVVRDSGSMPALVAFRAVQGAGGGGLMIGAQAVLGEIVSPRERGRYLGLLGGVYVLAAVGGPLVGGFVIDHGSWRAIFALYPPLGLLAAVVVVRTVRLPRPQTQRPIDYAGAALPRGHRAGGGPARRCSRWHGRPPGVDWCRRSRSGPSSRARRGCSRPGTRRTRCCRCACSAIPRSPSPRRSAS